MARPCALTATMAVMCCRCQPRRRATVFPPFLTHTCSPTVVNCRKNHPHPHPRSRYGKSCRQLFLNVALNDYSKAVSIAAGSNKQRHAAIQHFEQVLKPKIVATHRAFYFVLFAAIATSRVR